MSNPYQQGEFNPCATLTWGDVRRIRQKRASEGAAITYRELARAYGVSVTAIKRVIHNEKWVDPGYTPPVRRTYNRRCRIVN